jgi:hypothetical protein
MKTDERRLAIAEYKKRPAVAGIYAVRCAATGKAWVGQTPNLEKIQNRIWFSLRTGTHPNQALQRAWAIDDGASLSFEILERLKEDELPYVRDRLLGERALHWRSALGATTI